MLKRRRRNEADGAPAWPEKDGAKAASGKLAAKRCGESGQNDIQASVEPGWALAPW
jgi:hypothetical protein